MTQVIDLARIDQILDELEHEAEDQPDVRKFTLRLLEALRLVTGASSAVFVAAIGVDGSRSADSQGEPQAIAAEVTWLTLGLVGEPLAVDVGEWLQRLPQVDVKSDAETLRHGSRMVWRVGGQAYFANGLLGDLGLVGAIVISLSEPCPSAAEQGLLALVQGFGEILGDRLRSHQRRCWAESEGHFDRFLTELYAARNLEELSGVLAHDLPTLFKCQRVSVIRRKTMGRWRVCAVTGATKVDHRTETIVALERFASEAVHQGRPLLCRAPQTLSLSRGSASEFQTAENAAPDALLLPLADHGSEPPGVARNADISQILVLQWSDAEGVSASLPRLRRVLPHLAVAWSHANRGSRRSIGAWLPNRLGRSPRLAVLGRWATLAAIAGLLLWATIGIEVDFDIEATGHLEPVDQRFVFATHDGHVEELAVEDGSHVVPGQLLVQLRSSDLELRQREIEGEIATARKRRDGLSIAINQLNPGQRDTLITSRQLAAEVESLDEKLNGLAGLQELLRKQQDSLSLRCPIQGTVVTWDARRNLESRPVKRGDSLLKVARITGPWRLRLWLPDRELSHVKAVALQPVGDQGSELQLGPQVTFRMISRPGEYYHGNLVSIGNTVQVLDGLGPVIPVDFSFDRDQVPGLQVGATAAGRIHCGRRHWWYVWTRTLVETLQRRFWFMGGVS